MRIPRLLAALAAIATTLPLVPGLSGHVSAVPIVEQFRWGVSGPTTRFTGTAISENGAIAFAVIDRSYTSNPPAKGYRSADGGAIWSEMTTMPSRYWQAVDTSADGQVVFATGFVVNQSSGLDDAVFRSTNSGATWVSVLDDASSPSDYFGDVSVSENGNKVVIATSNGLRVSNDQGQTWSVVSSGDITAAELSGNGAVLMVAHRNQTVEKSTNGGQTWSTVYATPRNWSIIHLSSDGQSAIAVATRNDPVAGGLYFTHDGGATWTDAGLSPTFQNGQYAIGAMSPDGNTMIASSYYTAPRVSRDGGATWSVLPTSVTNRITDGWTNFAISNPDSSSLLNSTDSRIIGVTEGHRIARFGFRNAPSVSNRDQYYGRIAGGRTVVIGGQDFTDATAVSFGGTPATSYTVDSDTQITAVTPPHAAGEVVISVSNSMGTSTENITYTYIDTPAPVITAVTPTSVGTAGLSEIQVTGSNFDHLYGITINGNPVLEMGQRDQNTISVIVTELPAGPATLVLTTETGEATAQVTFDPSRNPPDRPYTEITNLNAAGLDNQYVFAFGETADGSLISVGSFQNAGNVAAADCIAVWNNGTWSAIGSDGAGDGSIDCDRGYWLRQVSVAADGHIFVLGRFKLRGSSIEYDVAEWDGSQWIGRLIHGDVVGNVWQIEASSASRVYVAGNFGDFAGIADCNHIAFWDGTRWSCPGSAPGAPALDDWVQQMALSPSGNLYVAGYFTNAGGVDAADYLAMWNGSSWSALGDDGAGGPVIDSNTEVESIAVTQVLGVDVVIISTHQQGPVVRPSVRRYVGGTWSTLINDPWMNFVWTMRILRDGTIMAWGTIGDTATRGLNALGYLRGGAWHALSITTAYGSQNPDINGAYLMSDGRVVINRPTTFGSGNQPHILIFDPVEAEVAASVIPEVVTELPATGHEPTVWPAAVLVLIGVVLRSVGRRRITAR